MKIAIISDIHYGEGEAYGKANPETKHNTRLEDIDATVRMFFDFVLNEENQIDIAINAGDIYKSRKPTPTQQHLYTRTLADFARRNTRHIPFIMFPGNHDLALAEDAHTTSALSEVLSLYNSDIKVLEQPTATEIGDTLIVTMPYLYRQKLNLASNPLVVDLYRELIQKFARETSCTHKVLIGHQTVEGVDIVDCQDINSFNEIVVPKDILSDYNAVFFGHIHKYQLIQEANPLIVNHGNPINLNFGETDPKGFVVYDTETGKHTKIIIPCTQFLCIEVDAKAKEVDATKLICDTLSEKASEIEGKILRIEAEIKQEDLPIRTLEIRPLVESAKFFDGIKTFINRKKEPKQVVVATKDTSVRVLLAELAKARDYTDEYTDEYIRLGSEIEGEAL